ncbi:MAG: T9SS type A sorting domain-containing protein, partial [Crocinitomicaceae bacterium]
EKLSIIFFFESFFCFSQPIITTYSTNNSGLTFNTVRCIVIQNNIKWFGTDKGLCSFDGQNWQTFTTENSPLLDDDIRSIKVENDSTIWIGTIQGGLYKKTNNTWINYNESNSGLHDNLVRGIEVDSSGIIWLATSEGVSRFDGVNWYLWNIANNGLLTNNITSIRTGFLNEKYVGTINGGLLYFDAQDNLTMHSIVESGLPDNSSLAIDIDSTGQPWFATPAAGLVTDWGNGGPWERWNMSNSPIPTNGLTCIAINQEDQRIFMGTELFGIIIKKGDVWFNYTQENIGLPEDHVTSIAHESPTVKWIGTFNSGVVRIEESNANLFDYEIQTLKLYPTIIEINDNLHLSELVNGSITIFNCSGQIVQEQSVQETSEFRLSVANSGFYYVKLSTNLKTYIFKIVVK